MAHPPPVGTISNRVTGSKSLFKDLFEVSASRRGRPRIESSAKVSPP